MRIVDDHALPKNHAKTLIAFLCAGLILTVVAEFVHGPEPDVFEDGDAAARAWADRGAVAHALFLVAFPALAVGFIGLYAAVAGMRGSALALAGATASAAAFAAFVALPAVSALALPAIGQAHVDGSPDAIPVLRAVVSGLEAVVMPAVLLALVGQVLLAVGLARSGLVRAWAAAAMPVTFVVWIGLELAAPAFMAWGALAFGVGGMLVAEPLWNRQRASGEPTAAAAAGVRALR